jgi:hypothetical protein
MQSDTKLERQYIITKLYERERRNKLTDAELKEDTPIRYILERSPLTKHRYRISLEYYKVAGHDGLSYIIMAKDGTTKTISRWRLFPVHDVKKLKMGTSFSNNRGELDAITDYDKATRKYNVTFKMPDGTTTHDTVKAINLRGSNPQLPTEMEKEYFRLHPEKK